MTATALHEAPVPAQNARLHRLLPHLAEALDAGVMRDALEGALFASSGGQVVGCGRPKPEITGDACSIHYDLRVRAPHGGESQHLVLGTLFNQPGAATEFERARLRPIAAAAAASESQTTGVIAGLGLALSLFPVSAAHPTLVHAVDAERVADVLQHLLGGSRPGVAAVELVRLRRSRGCVLRYRLEGGAPEVIFGKVGYPAAARDVQAALDGLRESDGLSRGSLVFPRGLGRSAELDATFVAALPGRPPDLQGESERARAVDVAAAVAARLHGSALSAGDVHTLDDELARAREPVALLRQFDAGFAERLSTVLDMVATLAQRSAPQAPVFSHGSFAPSQLMFDGDSVGLLDFERICHAEPAFDLGRFLSSLRLAVSRSGGADTEALSGRFLDGYVAAGGGAEALRRAPLYETAALVRTCAHSWLQLKSSRLQHAVTQLDSCVETLGAAA